MTDLARLVVTMEANSAKFLKEFERVDRRLNRWEKNAKRSFKNVEASFSQFQSAIAALGIGLLFREIVRASDSLTLISGRLRIVTKDSEDLVNTQRALFQVAQDTRSSFAATAELYTRTALAARSVGIEQKKLLQIVKVVNQAVLVSGASPEEAAGAIRQFTQAIASAELRGQELRSVMEQMPRVAIAIADGLGVQVGQLLKLGAAGELTIDRVIPALLSQADKIEKEMAQMPRTVGQAMQQLQNQMLLLAGAADTSGLVDSIDSLREVLTDPATVDGLRAFASGVVGAFAAMAKFAAETAQITKFLAQNLAAIVGGANDPVRIDQRLQQLRSDLKRETFVDPLTAQTIRVTDKEKEAIREEIKLLEARQRVIQEFGEFGKLDTDVNIKINSTLDGAPNGFDELEKKTEAALKSAIQSLETESETATRVFHERRQLILDNVRDEELRLRLLDKLNQQWAESMENAADKAADALDEVDDKLSVIADQMVRNMQTFTASIVDAALAGEDLGDAVVASLRRIAAEILTTAILRGVIGEQSGGSFSGGLLSAFLNSFVGRQHGGPLSAGQPAIVGEAGPELFVPRVSGVVIPNDALGGMKIEQKIDARGADPASAANMIRALKLSNEALIAQIEMRQRRGLAA